MKFGCQNIIFGVVVKKKIQSSPNLKQTKVKHNRFIQQRRKRKIHGKYNQLQAMVRLWAIKEVMVLAMVEGLVRSF